ncbi:MAG: universal stress protein [Methanosarcinales archaeon]|nr:universal stress protein [Methanosarcinales archaeon]
MTKLQFLVPVDGSENSRRAAEHAVQLADKYGAEISSMFVADIHKYAVPDILEIVKSAGREYVEQVRKLAKSKGVAVNSIKVLVGSPVDQIIIEANAMDINLIIIAATGRGKLKISSIGAVANRILRFGNSHVLLIRDTENREYYKNILISTDGSKDAEYAAQFGLSIAKRYNAKVTACTIINSREKIIERHITSLEDAGRGKVFGETVAYPEAIIKRMRQHLLDDAAKIAEKITEIADEKGVTAEIIVKDGKTTSEILKIVKNQKIDLVVLGSTGKSSISKMMVGSISEKVASTANCSVLVVRGSRIERIVPE